MAFISFWRTVGNMDILLYFTTAEHQIEEQINIKVLYLYDIVYSFLGFPLCNIESWLPKNNKVFLAQFNLNIFSWELMAFFFALYV